MRFGEDIPERILKKPELHLGLAVFLNAWFELDVERVRPARIERSACFRYADDYDFSLEQKEDLWSFISIMDTEFIPWWKKRQPKKRNEQDSN